MNKAFIFDMDGVLIDTERRWIAEDPIFLASLFGKEIADKIGDTTGVNVNEIYAKAISYGGSVPMDVYLKKYDDRAASIHARSAITQGTDGLIKELLSREYRLGLVSASRRTWIDGALLRLPFRDKFGVIISVNDESLPSKPAPDGYIEALRRLEANPKQSIVLEDSNRGIAAGKAAGCFVIGYREYLLPNQEQAGADAYADTMDDVIRIVEERNS